MTRHEDLLDFDDGGGGDTIYFQPRAPSPRTILTTYSRFFSWLNTRPLKHRPLVVLQWESRWDEPRALNGTVIPTATWTTVQKVSECPAAKGCPGRRLGPVTTRMASSDYRQEVYSLVLGGGEGDGGR